MIGGHRIPVGGVDIGDAGEYFRGVHEDFTYARSALETRRGFGNPLEKNPT